MTTPGQKALAEALARYISKSGWVSRADGDRDKEWRRCLSEADGMLEDSDVRRALAGELLPGLDDHPDGTCHAPVAYCENDAGHPGDHWNPRVQPDPMMPPPEHPEWIGEQS